jgi:hypothetical protein
MNCIHLTHYKVQLWTVVNTKINFQVPETLMLSTQAIIAVKSGKPYTKLMPSVGKRII